MEAETRTAIDRLTRGTVSAHTMAIGRVYKEPLLVSMDAMLRYAKAFEHAYGFKLGEDRVLGECFAEAIKGLRGLLDGQGAVAMERGLTSDSKDNGLIEEIFWQCCEVAGLDGDTL